MLNIHKMKIFIKIILKEDYYKKQINHLEKIVLN